MTPIGHGSSEQIQAILLHVQIRIEPTRRTYGEVTGPGLEEVVRRSRAAGVPTMRGLLWTHAHVMVLGLLGQYGRRYADRMHVRLQYRGDKVFCLS